MSTLLWITLAVAVSAIVVTLRSLRTAPEGFEDGSGFHFAAEADAPKALPISRRHAPVAESLPHSLQASHS